MEQKLKDYIEGKIHYTPIQNIMMNNHSKDWYIELGKYITETIDVDQIPSLKFFSKKLKDNKSIVTKIKDFINTDNNRIYSAIGISFITSVLGEQSLISMFGEPLLHNEFGEGFSGDYNEKTDEYDEPEIKESYVSYFVNVGGTEFHIGYDHRGTRVEIEIPKKFNHDENSDEDAKKCFESLKKLVDLYKEKN